MTTLYPAPNVHPRLRRVDSTLVIFCRPDPKVRVTHWRPLPLPPPTATAFDPPAR